MQALKLSEEKALKLYPTAPDEWKQILEDSFGKEFFNKKITDRIRTFEDACSYNGSDPTEDRFTKGSENTIAFEKLKEIAKALCQGVELSYKNTDQYKWYPWHEYSASGFRFDVSLCVIAAAIAPARLCVPDRATSDYFGKQFIDLFEQYKN